MTQKTYRCELTNANSLPGWPRYFGCTSAELECWVGPVDRAAIMEMEVGQKHIDDQNDTWERLT